MAAVDRTYVHLLSQCSISFQHRSVGPSLLLLDLAAVILSPVRTPSSMIRGANHWRSWPAHSAAAGNHCTAIGLRQSLHGFSSTGENSTARQVLDYLRVAPCAAPHPSPHVLSPHHTDRHPSPRKSRPYR